MLYKFFYTICKELGNNTEFAELLAIMVVDIFFLNLLLLLIF